MLIKCWKTSPIRPDSLDLWSLFSALWCMNDCCTSLMLVQHHAESQPSSPSVLKSQILLPDTGWSCQILLDTQRYLKILRDTVWYQTIPQDTGWSSQIPLDTQWYLKILGDTVWYQTIPQDTGWSPQILPDTQWYLKILEDTVWYQTIPRDTSWSPQIPLDI